MRIWIIISAIVIFSIRSTEAQYKLEEWERGLAIYPETRPELRMYLWFYEWNMFGAVLPEQHTRGDWDNEVSVSEEGKSAEILCEPFFNLNAEVDATGATLTLTARNRSDRDWPELAGIIPCFNPGPESERTEPFANTNSWFVSADGLTRLELRQIHFRDLLRRKVDGQAENGRYAWSEKWPKSDPDATSGLLLRESSDGRWVTGISWNRFLSSQGHNPWSCLHLGIHLGPLRRDDSRIVKGKIYLIEGDRNDLLRKHREDIVEP